MKKNPTKLFITGILFLIFCFYGICQTNNPSPFCAGTYSTVTCSQPGLSNDTNNTVNDFIDGFYTTGGSTEIVNLNSGCNGLADNYIYYCEHYLVMGAAQTITCTMKSGITFPQGFAIFIDWNQNNSFDFPGEYIVSTQNVPNAATWISLTFTVPSGLANGIYRMRVRCAYGSPGSLLTPCGTFPFGETEDYTIYVGLSPQAPLTATVSTSSVICSGQSPVLALNYSGTSPATFTWTGPNNFLSVLQNPVLQNATTSMSGTYSVLVSRGPCSVIQTISITVSPNPTVTVNSATICIGDTAHLMASGATIYLWNNGSSSGNVLASPSLTTIFTVTATTGNCSVTKTSSVQVMPPLMVSSGSALICQGDSVTLKVTGASSYSWNTGSSSPTLVISPSITTSYTVNANNGVCNTSAVYTQSVDVCTALINLRDKKSPILIYPNPFKNELNIVLPDTAEIMLTNALGGYIMQKTVSNYEVLNTAMLAEGIYFLLIKGPEGKIIKIIKN